MAFIKEIVIAVLFTAIALAQLPNFEVPGGLPVNQSIPAIPETPIGNNTQIPENPIGNNTQIPAMPENPIGNNTQIPALPATNGTMPEVTVPPVPGATTPSVPGQEGVQSTEAPSRLMNAINTINGNRG